VVIITTPQEISVIDARKALIAFRKLSVPVIGVVENMSYFEDAASGVKHRIFGEGGGRKMAEEAKAPLLVEIPIDPNLREASDNGMPKNNNRYFDIIADAVVG
jgi:ATP-binding protein involved in chromosome partitioning